MVADMVPLRNALSLVLVSGALPRLLNHIWNLVNHFEMDQTCGGFCIEDEMLPSCRDENVSINQGFVVKCPKHTAPRKETNGS